MAALFEKKRGQMERAFRKTGFASRGWELADVTQCLYANVQRNARRLLEQRLAARLDLLLEQRRGVRIELTVDALVEAAQSFAARLVTCGAAMLVPLSALVSPPGK